MKNILILVFTGFVFLLSYGIYLDTKVKKKEQVNKIITEAEQNLKVLEDNPNHSRLTSFKQISHP